MKTLKFSLFLAILFACFSFFACDPINPPDPPDPPIDTVIVKVTLDLPIEVILTQVTVSVLHPSLKDGMSFVLTLENTKVFEFTFTGEEAKALIGETVTIGGTQQGHINGNTVNIKRDGTSRSLVVKKGLNEITMHFTVEYAYN